MCSWPDTVYSFCLFWQRRSVYNYQTLHDQIRNPWDNWQCNKVHRNSLRNNWGKTVTLLPSTLEVTTRGLHLYRLDQTRQDSRLPVSGGSRVLLTPWVRRTRQLRFESWKVLCRALVSLSRSVSLCKGTYYFPMGSTYRLGESLHLRPIFVLSQDVLESTPGLLVLGHRVPSLCVLGWSGDRNRRPYLLSRQILVIPPDPSSSGTYGGYRWREKDRRWH